MGLGDIGQETWDDDFVGGRMGLYQRLHVRVIFFRALVKIEYDSNSRRN